MKRLVSILALVSIVGSWSPAGPQAVAGDAEPGGGDALAEAQRTLRLLNRISDTLPREPIEPAQLAERVLERTDDVAGLTDWVASSVDWLPYTGALRGPRGVLIERRGNSLDQALLLAEAMGEAGREVRLAHAVLPPELAREVHAGLRVAAASTLDAPPDAAESGDGLQRYARTIGADPEQLRRAHEALEIQGQRLLERVLPLAVGQARELGRLLGEAGVEGSADGEAAEAAEVAALREHWWVQTAEDGGAWKDHDPVALRAGIDVALEPDTTCTPGELSPESRHRMTLRVVAERTDGAGIHREVALTHETDAASTAGGHFVLTFQALNLERAGDPGSTDEEAAAHLLRLASVETEWMPSLMVVDYQGTGEEHHEASIYTDGTLNPEPRLDTNERKIGSAASALGSADRAREESESELTAVWIEYTLAAPGRAPRVVRRNLFDLIGEARRRSGEGERLELSPEQVVRRGLALSGYTQIVPEACEPSTEFLIRLDLATRLKNQRVLVELAQAVRDGEEPDPARMVQALSLPPLDLHVLSRTRLTVGRYAERIHLAELGVLASHVQPTDRSATLGISFARAIDLVSNAVAVRAPLPGEEAAASAWDVRLEQGVLDTVLETATAVVREGVGTPDERDLADNPATWMQRRPDASWRVLGPGADAGGAAGDLHARVAEALGAGQVAVVPRAALEGTEGGAWAPACWWRVDPATGETLGIGPRGWGQEVTERAAVETVSAKVSKVTMQSVACFFGMSFARLLFSLGAAGISSELGGTAGSLGMGYVLAALSQAGVMGDVWSLLTELCEAILGG